MQNYFHFMGRTKDRKPFNLSQKWQNEEKRLSHLQKEKKIQVHAYVLMPNHFHLLGEIQDSFTFKDLDLDLDLSFEAIDNRKNYWETYKYIYMNPVRANLTREPQFYPYSLLHFQYYKKTLPYQNHSRMPIGLGGIEGEVHWIKKS